MIRQQHTFVLLEIFYLFSALLMSKIENTRVSQILGVLVNSGMTTPIFGLTKLFLCYIITYIGGVNGVAKKS